MKRNEFAEPGAMTAAGPQPAREAERHPYGASARAAETRSSTAQVPAGAEAVLSFWTAAGPTMWFAKDPDFDLDFRNRFIGLHEAAARGELSGWGATPDGALALVVLLDQFPRNAFRGTAQVYATDGLARSVADDAIRAGHDRSVDPMLALFFYLPFAHSEDLLDQERSVRLAQHLPPPVPEHAKRHRDIIYRFGRFPHRNAILGRATTPDEAEYLASGGFAG